VELIALFESIPHANLYSVAIGLGAFVIVRLMKAYVPKAPAALIALILMTVIVACSAWIKKGLACWGRSVGTAIPDAAKRAAGRLFAPAARRHGVVGITCARHCCWSAAAAVSTTPRRTVTRCCLPTAWPV